MKTTVKRSMKAGLLITALTTGIATISGCTVQPTASGGYNISTPSFSQILSNNSGPASSASTEQAQPAENYINGPARTTTYDGQVDGGTGTMQVTPIGHGRFKIELSALASGGSLGQGGVSGVIEPNVGSPPSYKLVKVIDEGANPGPCGLTVKFTENSAVVGEDYSKGGCSYYHGGALSFDGELTRK